jgi:hypothetical protein
MLATAPCHASLACVLKHEVDSRSQTRVCTMAQRRVPSIRWVQNKPHVATEVLSCRILCRNHFTYTYEPHTIHSMSILHKCNRRISSVRLNYITVHSNCGAACPARADRIWKTTMIPHCCSSSICESFVALNLIYIGFEIRSSRELHSEKQLRKFRFPRASTTLLNGPPVGARGFHFLSTGPRPTPLHTLHSHTIQLDFGSHHC